MYALFFRAAAKLLVVCACYFYFYIGLLLQSLSSCVHAFLGLLNAKFFSVHVCAFFPLGLLQSLSLCWRAFKRAAAQRVFELLQSSVMCARAFPDYCKAFPMRVCDVFSGYCKVYRCMHILFLGLLDAKTLVVCVCVLLIGLLQSLSLCWRAFNRAATQRVFRAVAKFLVACACSSWTTGHKAPRWVCVLSLGLL